MRIALLNTTIVTAEGQYDLQAITAEQASGKFPEGMAAMDGDKRGMYFESAIGHESTAEAMSALLGFPVPVARIRFEQSEGQFAICLRVKGRVEEGQILDRETLDEIGYDLYLLTRLSPIEITEPIEIGNILGPYKTHQTFPHTMNGITEALRLAKHMGANGGPIMVGEKVDCPLLAFEGGGELLFGGFSPTMTLPPDQGSQ